MNKRIGILVNQIAPGGASASGHLLMRGLVGDKSQKFIYASDCRFENVKQEMEKTATVRMVQLDQILSNQTNTSSESAFQAGLATAELQTKKIH